MRLCIAADQVDVWRASLAALPDLQAVLSPDELDRAARFHFEEDSRHFIAARGWLRTVLARYLDTSPADLRFDYGARGKPVLSAGCDLRFNLSHSHDLALLAVTKKRELGIDVEFIKESIVGPEIAECFFSAAEIAELHALPREQQRAAFFAGWTRKESYIKGTGAACSARSTASPFRSRRTSCACRCASTTTSARPRVGPYAACISTKAMPAR